VEGKDQIKDLFSNTLNNHELPVRADLWQGIASQIGTTTSLTTTSIWTKLAVGTVGLATAGMVIYALFNGDDKKTPIKEKTPTEQTVKRTKDQGLTKKDKTKELTSTQLKTKVKVAKVLTTVPFLDLIQVVENAVNEKQDQSFVTVPDLSSNVDLVQNQPLISMESSSSIITSKEPSNSTVLDPVISNVEQLISSSEQSEQIGTLINVFTPNGDNINDFLLILSDNLSDFQVVVLDRINKIVFKSSDPKFTWDGIGVSGEPVPTGNYLYFITARDGDGKPINKSSTLRIER